MSSDPWTPDPVGGAELLDDVLTFLTRFVAFPSDAAATATTLWAAHAHLVTASDSSPRLALLSPEPGSGKTRTLEVLELLTPQPMHMLSASPAAIFRTLATEQPTLLM
ncbi:MAG: DNA primase, partial [Actinomycetota bacterium]|nr:DNA primase [Actinomycetota bacterium]